MKLFLMNLAGFFRNPIKTIGYREKIFALGACM
jgi:hypothetical protein